MTYTLIDGRKMNATHPETFEIPSMREVLKIKPGDFVKIGFTTPGASDNIRCERMWVKVTGLRTGILANDPVFTPMKHGDVVEYQDRNILDIMAPGKQKA